MVPLAVRTGQRHHGLHGVRLLRRQAPGAGPVSYPVSGIEVTGPSGYTVLPGEDDRAVKGEIISRGYRPFEAGDPMDEAMPVESLRVVVQIGTEYLARLGGAATGNLIGADLVNRGLLAFLRDRDRFGTGHHA
jgi:hypothetical protein